MPRPRIRHGGLAVLLALLAVATVFADQPEHPRITVVAIVATDRDSVVDDKLKAIAEEVRKYEPDLKGFKIARSTCLPVPIGNTETFKLVDEVELTVKVSEVAAKEGRYYLVVKPPLVGEITYSTCPDKYFPIVTRYVTTKDKDRLIIAIMVTAKK
jgi:hypothetical protein